MEKFNLNQLLGKKIEAAHEFVNVEKARKEEKTYKGIVTGYNDYILTLDNDTKIDLYDRNTIEFYEGGSTSYNQIYIRNNALTTIIYFD